MVFVVVALLKVRHAFAAGNSTQSGPQVRVLNAYDGIVNIRHASTKKTLPVTQ